MPKGKYLRNLPHKPIKELEPEDLGRISPNTVCVVRYGAIGDMIMASSIFPELKKQGYRVCLNTTKSGYEIVKYNPFIDEFLLQDNKQVKNLELGEYWEFLGTCFQYVINLSESIEGALLMMPPRLLHLDGVLVEDKGHEDYFKKDVHEKYNINYIERTHKIAGVPFSHETRFFPSPKEDAWAKKERNKLGGDHIIMVVLSGTASFKAYPHVDAVMAQVLMKTSGTRFLLVGDTTCQILEAGWELENRVIRRSGKYSVRQTLSLLKYMDVVMGPETGMLNAASMLPNRKIIYLSHSSVENLTKHWVNTLAVAGDVECYPCHKMHFDGRYCNREKETGAALCSYNIDPSILVDHIMEVIR